MTKMILPLDFFLLGGAFISPCENEELTVESGIPACQLAKPNSLEDPENNRSQPVEQPEEYIKMSPLPSCWHFAYLVDWESFISGGLYEQKSLTKSNSNESIINQTDRLNFNILLKKK